MVNKTNGATISKRANEFIKSESAKIAEPIFRAAIKEVAYFYGMSNKQLKSLKFKQEGMDIVIKWRYHGPVRGNKAVQRWFIKPKKPGGVLHWIAKTPAARSFPQFNNVSGSFSHHAFSKGHYIRGIDARYVLNKGIKVGTMLFHEALKTKLEQYLAVTN